MTGRRLFGTFLAVLLVPGLVAGCGDKKKKKKDDDEPKKDEAAATAKAMATAKATTGATVAATSAPTQAPTAAPVATTPPPPSGSAGAAYFVVDGRGLVELASDGKLNVIKGSEREILMSDLQVGADGAVYVRAGDGIKKVDGGAFKDVVKTKWDTTGSVDQFVVKGPNDIWTTSYKGVAHWDGKAWTLDDKKTLGEKVTLLNGLALDAKGRPWVASTDMLHFKDGAEWKSVKLPKDKPFLRDVVATPTGDILTLASGGLYKATESGAQEIKLDAGKTYGYDQLAIAQNGNIGYRTYDLVGAAPPAGTGGKVWNKVKDFKLDYVRAVAVDNAGRAWVGGPAGISILGDPKIEWLTGTFEELSGEIRGITVVGAGPATMPTPGAPKTVPSLKGKVLDGGSALANADVEICPSPGLMFKDTPCGESPVKSVGKTNGNGEFEFKDVPLGTYGVAVKKGAKWQVTLGSRANELKAGQAYDMGSIKLK